MILGRRGSATTGTQTSALSISGEDPSNAKVANTEKYDGTSWSATSNVSLARTVLGAAGTQSAGLAFGGNPPASGTTATEEFTSIEGNVTISES
jgi:hypothetical protein